MAKIMTLKTEKNTEKNTENRAILHITGKDAFAFLQGLITNDMAKTALNNNAGNNGGLVYTALLSPQGKYLFDFFVLEDRGDYLGAGYLIDIDAECADGFCQRLTMYKLRADVQIEKTIAGLPVGWGIKRGMQPRTPTRVMVRWVGVAIILTRRPRHLIRSAIRIGTRFMCGI